MSDRPIGPQVPIRALREAFGFSVPALIERIEQADGPKNTHPDTIRNVELGYKRASKPLMTAWAKALGLSSLDVFQPEPLKSSRDRVA
ncbi:XRE family transcriptional regulator [Mycobacteroides abscessus]|uniref:XRE family transcriptional regulator n=1 Tax=Mycobacteroides abscessus TaxID=36809 RepID=UPI000E694D8B|nr:XRE family transcriptional regulator [Mycobacteroides abscessus]RIQ99288.1 XRE family transcriptional regulator [Mycobacteroides abscessus]